MFDPVVLFLMSFCLEMMDNGLGGGFGTILSPLLIMFGYDPRVVVPSILVSEMVSGLWGGAWHFKFKNVDFKVIGLTLLGSLTGMVLATFLIGEFLPATAAKQFISLIALLMGVFVVLRSFNFKPKPEKPGLINKLKFVVLGMIAGFNKGGSGGGYGPLSVSGYMSLGLVAATAIGTTTIAEGIACTLGVFLYSRFTGIVIAVALPITLGAFIADPVSAWMNNSLKLKLEPPFHGRVIGVAMTVLGVITLLKSLGYISV